MSVYVLLESVSQWHWLCVTLKEARIVLPEEKTTALADLGEGIAQPLDKRFATGPGTARLSFHMSYGLNTPRSKQSALKIGLAVEEPLGVR